MAKILNADDNFRLVADFGDEPILNVGSTFSNFAKYLKRERIEEFCQNVNSDLTFCRCGFRLMLNKDNNDIFCLKLTRNGTEKGYVKLLDYTIYCEAKEKDWSDISGYGFNFILYSWRNFLAKYVVGYRDQFNKTITMSRIDNVSAL